MKRICRIKCIHGIDFRRWRFKGHTFPVTPVHLLVAWRAPDRAHSRITWKLLIMFAW